MVMRDTGAALTNTSQLIKGSLQHAMLKQDFGDLQAIMDNVASQPGIKAVVLLNRDSVIRFAPEQNGVGTQLNLSDPACQLCHQPGGPPDKQNVVFTNAAGERVLRNCNPIENLEPCHQCHDPRVAINGALITDFSLTETDAHLTEDLNTSVFLGGGAIALVVLTINLLMNRLVLARLVRLAGVLQRFGQGDLGQRLPRDSVDELGAVSDAFNRMASSLQDKNHENARLYAELEQKEAVRAQLLEKVMAAQEEERRRIARDLHDEFAQTLTALTIHLQSAMKNLPDGMAVLHQQFKETQNLTAQTLKEVTQWILELRPTVLDDLGLVPAIRWYAENRLDPLKIRVSVEAIGLKQRLPAGIETVLFRIVQEAVNNIAKHAHAHAVHIRLEVCDDKIRATIEDDGIGFDAEDALALNDGMRGLGLLGMRERAGLVRGTLAIDSQIGHGTRLQVEVPWTKPG
jgi:signal transduction histidine kinase